MLQVYFLREITVLLYRWKLIHKFSVTLFTDNFFFSVGCECCGDFFHAFCAGSLVYFSWISLGESVFMSLIWMLLRYLYVVFYMKSEFLLDDFKWFSSDFTLEYTSEDIFYIFLGLFISYYFLIILLNRKC